MIMIMIMMIVVFDIIYFFISLFMFIIIMNDTVTHYLRRKVVHHTGRGIGNRVLIHIHSRGKMGKLEVQVLVKM